MSTSRDMILAAVRRQRAAARRCDAVRPDI